MSFTITNQRNQSQFEARTDETILDAALRDNRIYPYGCRSGTCGACKSILVSGEVDYGEYQDFALNDADKADGKLLLCQAVPLDDVTIDVEEVLTGQGIQIKMLPCRVNKIDKLANDVVRLYLGLPKTQEFNFIAGQYIDIILKDGQRRSFSIGNLPDAAKQEGIEIHVRHVPGGHFTPRVFQSLKERDLLRFEGPFGTCFLQTEPEKPIIMIAGGTGFSPIKGLIEQAMEKDPQYQIHLFRGARDEQDLYLDQLVKKWQQQYPGLNYTPVVSEPNNQSWSGATGFVHQTVAASFASFANFDVYASGPPIMVDAVRTALLEKGMKEENYRFDSFDFAPRG